jgi:hypothetical protein
VTGMLVNIAHFLKRLAGNLGHCCFQIRGAWMMMTLCSSSHGVGGSEIGLRNLIDLLTTS